MTGKSASRMPQATVYPGGRRVGPPASSGRGGSAVLLDFVLCLVMAVPTAFTAALAYAIATEGNPLGLGTTAALLWGSAVCCSFLNQVLFGRWFGGSLGKLMLGLRVIRAEDGGRPHFWRLLRRWLVGLLLVPFALLAVVIDLDGADVVTGKVLGIDVVHREIPEGPALTPEERAAQAEKETPDRQPPSRAARERQHREEREWKADQARARKEREAREWQAREARDREARRRLGW
ncbi:RDD family protein [Streptomyces sp. SID11385]|uniref:RDD family protein n=1 Tax=Streptomyces sp. SID11385 TaxID=2706031 RepID=UPI0013C620DA|nr:RDD family protein [Streptomyces sp. SID11385]NEA41339.1 RDD family protein [Streptomyces sp. SID11385]